MNVAQQCWMSQSTQSLCCLIRIRDDHLIQSATYSIARRLIFPYPGRYRREDQLCLQGSTNEAQQWWMSRWTHNLCCLIHIRDDHLARSAAVVAQG